MFFEPVSEEKANENVRKDYQRIKKALDNSSLPLFFSYIGVIPEYLDYLTEQLVPILQSRKFADLISETEKEIESLIKETLTKSEELEEWLGRYEHSPSFYNFQKDLIKIFTVNLKLAFIFVALREALKGWAVAAKKLSSSNFDNKDSDSRNEMKDFVFAESSLLVISNNQLQAREENLSETGKLEKDLLPKYIFLCQMDYLELIKTEKYLILRVGIEKLILSSLPLLPEKIISPINVYYRLAQKYQEFPELLYLLYDHFPTLAVQKMLFSGFMKE